MCAIDYKPPSIAMIEKEFQLFDSDNSGSISINEFYDILTRLKCNYPKKLIDEIFTRVDTDKNNKITLDGNIIIFSF